MIQILLHVMNTDLCYRLGKKGYSFGLSTGIEVENINIENRKTWLETYKSFLGMMGIYFVII